MKKGYITLKNGSIFSFDYNTQDECISFLKSYERDEKASSSSNHPEEVPVRKVEEAKVEKKRKDKNNKVFEREAWSDRDIINVARIIESLMGASKKKHTAYVRKYVKKDADYKMRSSSSQYAIANRLRAYFEGRSETTGEHIVGVLEANGIKPIMRAIETPYVEKDKKSEAPVVTENVYQFISPEEA